MRLYLEIMGEELRPDPKSPTGYACHMVSSGKCAVFDQKQLDELIAKTQKKLRELRELRNQAERYSGLISEYALKGYGVPYTVHKFIKKKC